MPDTPSSFERSGLPSRLRIVGRPALREYLELVKRIDKDDPAPADIQAVRDMLRAHPDLWRVAGDLAQAAALSLVSKLNASPPVVESLKRAWTAIQADLGSATASPLERMLIEQVALCWLHLYLVQLEYTNVMSEPIPLASADHWERRLSSTQRRYLSACDALARVRRLATAGSAAAALQVNIAAPGGRQVNLLGPEPAGEN